MRNYFYWLIKIDRKQKPALGRFYREEVMAEFKTAAEVRAGEAGADLLYVLRALQFSAQEGRKHIESAGPDMRSAVFDDLDRRTEKAIQMAIGCAGTSAQAGIADDLIGSRK